MQNLNKVIQEAKKYSVNLYDKDNDVYVNVGYAHKDNDVYVNVGYAQDLQTAEIMLNTVMFMLRNKEITLKRSNGEPFDWAEIYSEEDKITVKTKYLSYKDEIIEAQN